MNSATGIGPVCAMRARISASSGVRSSVILRISRLTPQRESDEQNPGDEKRHAEQHAHGHAAPQESELLIRFAEEFTERPHYCIERRKGAEDQTGTPERAGPHHEAENDQQHEPLEARLIELARMARDRAGARKDHRPGYVGKPAPQLAIDEVGEAAEQDPDRRNRTCNVAERKHREFAYRGKSYDGDDTAEKTPMKRHAAIPDLENLQRMLDEMRQIVEQHIAGASAQDDAERHPKDEIVEVFDLQRRRPAPVSFIANHGAGIDPAQQNSENIRQRVPTDRERPNGHQHGVEVRKRNGRDRHDDGSGVHGFVIARPEPDLERAMTVRQDDSALPAPDLAHKRPR